MKNTDTDHQEMLLFSLTIPVTLNSPTKKSPKEEGIKPLTSKQWNWGLPVVLALGKACFTSNKILFQIFQILEVVYSLKKKKKKKKKTTRKVCNNVINWIQYKNEFYIYEFRK